MQKPTSINSEVQARLDEFWQKHIDYDPGWVRHVLHNVNEFLPLVFERDAVKNCVKLLYAQSGAPINPESDWIEMPELASAKELRPLTASKIALELRAYAYFGVKLRLGDSSDYADDFLELYKIGRVPREWMHDADAETTIMAALARQKLDHSDGGGLTPEELSALARVSRKSIMNLLAPSQRSVLQTDLDGCITVESALRWLLSRHDFRPSIWQEQERQSASQRPTQAASFIDAPVFVPSSNDGSWFSPMDRNQNDGLYYVANGETEERFEDYWDALDFLSHSASPRWRYKDAGERRRVKYGTGGWERKPRDEIERALLGANSGAKRNRRRQRP